VRERPVGARTDWPHRAANVLGLACLACGVGACAVGGAQQPHLGSATAARREGPAVGASQEVTATDPDESLTPREAAAVERSLTGRELPPDLGAFLTYSVLDRLPATDLLPAGSQVLVAGIVVFGERCGAECLCARTPDGFVVVDGPAALADRVRIRSAASALKYVRLFTSLSTAKLMREPWWYEIVPSARVGEPFLLGFKRQPQIFWTGEEGWPSGWFGILSRQDWGRSHLRGPRVEEVPKGFVVTRFLFKADEWHLSTHNALEVQETVSPTGHLRRDVVDTVRLSGITLEVQFES
jgi:hypothetical protein